MIAAATVKTARRMLCTEELTKVNRGVGEAFHGLCLAADGIRDAFGMDVAVSRIRDYVVMSLEAVEWFKAGGGEYMSQMLVWAEKSRFWVKKN